LKYEKINSKKLSFLICVIIGGLFISACSNTKYLSDNQSLLICTKVRCDSKEILKEDLKSILKQKANQKSLFFFRFYTTVYNTFAQGQGTNFKKWIITHIGNEPILFDETLAEKSQAQLQQFMNNKGYFQASVDKKIITKKKKTTLYFDITANKTYKLKEINYKCDDSLLLGIVQSKSKNSVLVSGTNFQVQNLEDERERLTKVMNRNGYCFFEKENITFEADSALLSNEINLTVSINQPLSLSPVDSIKKQLKHKKYIIRNTYIIVDYDYKEVLKNREAFIKSLDTTRLQENVFLLCKGKPYVNPRVVLNCNYIKNNDLYNILDVEKTKMYLSQNLIFRQTTIEFTDVSESDSTINGLLDCYIQISPSTKHSYSINLEGTNTGGDWGAQVKATYENRNLFHGAEMYNMKIRYSFEQNSLLQTSDNNKFNSREYGIDLGIVFPKFILPFTTQNSTKKYGLRTFIKAGYSFQKIPYYESPLRFLSYGYISKPNKYITHYFTPFEINGVQYIHKSDTLNTIIKQNKYNAKKYEDYFISSINYTMVWSNKLSDKIRNYSLFKFFIESTGNSLYAFSKLTNRPKIDGSYQVFNTTFAQYIKTDFDYRFYNVEGKELSTVYRIFFGYTLPFGNNTVVPYIKQYFVGGSNSLRAWTSGTLESTTKRGLDTSITYATRDVKLEANIEQRFPIFSFLNGAIFTDVGNVWSALKVSGQTVAQFGPQFYNNLAVSTGIGLRPNFSFFVLRVDFAVKMRNPLLDASKQWLWAQRNFSWDKDWNLTIGIGYPF